VFILKGVKVLCFDALLQVFILKDLEGSREWGDGEGNTTAGSGKENNWRESDAIYTGKNNIK